MYRVLLRVGGSRLPGSMVKIDSGLSFTMQVLKVVACLQYSDKAKVIEIS